MAPGVNVPSLWLGQDCRPLRGTSVAAPHVSGVIGLLLGKRAGLQPEQIRSILEWTADPSVGSNNSPAPLSRLLIGAGRINAFQALTAVEFDDVGYNDWFLKYVM